MVGHRRGRSRKSWLNNIKEWIDQSLCSLLHIADGRSRWAAIIAAAFVGVLQRPRGVTGKALRDYGMQTNHQKIAIGDYIFTEINHIVVHFSPPIFEKKVERQKRLQPSPNSSVCLGRADMGRGDIVAPRLNSPSYAFPSLINNINNT